LTELALDEIVDDRLGPFTLRRGVGLTVIVGDQRAALARLIEIAAGARRPRRGSARLDNEEIHRSPEARAKLGALLAEEALPPRASVGESAQLALGLRKPGAEADAALDEWGLARLRGESPERLGAEELRAVALCLALAAPHAAAIVLFDPLGLAAKLGHARIRDACWRAAERAVVIVCTTLLDDAAALGGELVLVLGGRVTDATLYARGLAREALVRSADSSRLAECLRADAELEVSFDAARSPRELFVRGASQALISERVLRAVREEGLALDALSPINRLGALR
jgi:ABC-type uncharacterized transport system YnjBCD ATPase subunit